MSLPGICVVSNSFVIHSTKPVVHIFKMGTCFNAKSINIYKQESIHSIHELIIKTTMFYKVTSAATMSISYFRIVNAGLWSNKESAGELRKHRWRKIGSWCLALGPFIRPSNCRPLTRNIDYPFPSTDAAWHAKCLLQIIFCNSWEYSSHIDKWLNPAALNEPNAQQLAWVLVSAIL